MSSTLAMPTQAEFLAAPVETVSAVAPRSMVYAPGGTRRSATFAGIEPWSAEFIRLGHDRFAECMKVIFSYGVEHVFTPALMVGHANEVEDVERQAMLPMGHFLTDEHLLRICREQGWRLRIVPSAYQETLRPFIELAEKNTPQDAKHTWWMTLTPSYESWWTNLVAIAKSDHISTRTDLIKALYGEEVPPITLCIAFGKLMVSPDLFPPLLMDNVQCYWSQQAGYSLTDHQFRMALYDFAYLRQTWRKDKTERAKEAMEDQELWEQEVIVGLGQRFGSFWYPTSPSLPE